MKSIFPKNLTFTPHPIIYDLPLLILLLTCFLLPIYLTFPNFLKELNYLFNSISNTLIWVLVLILIGFIGICGILGSEILWNWFRGRGGGDSVNVDKEKKQQDLVKEEKKKKKKVGIGEDPIIKKVWKDEILSETKSRSKSRSTNNNKEEEEELIEMKVLPKLNRRIPH